MKIKIQTKETKELDVNFPLYFKDIVDYPNDTFTGDIIGRITEDKIETIEFSGPFGDSSNCVIQVRKNNGWAKDDWLLDIDGSFNFESEFNEYKRKALEHINSIK